jgi:lipopolysaccharide/colanic/teichoic acid biosynthesis glycosyltransferase
MTIRRTASAPILDEEWAEGEKAEPDQDAVESHMAAAPVTLATSETATAPATASFYRHRGKRLVDLAIGIPLALVALPIVGASALAVLISSGRPVFYKADRVGRCGREFSMWKLRTMVRNADQVLAEWLERNPEIAAEYQANFKLRNDPRITRVGRFLRRGSLDELPQFWNVLRGEMSLVGPRPYYDSELSPFPATRAAIIAVRPGLTGPWQVRGRNSLAPSVRMFLDRKYVNTYDLRADLFYLLCTVRSFTRPDGL